MQLFLHCNLNMACDFVFQGQPSVVNTRYDRWERTSGTHNYPRRRTHQML